ncbi:hypothetical protein [Candidatus Pelagibacter sp. HIMB1495]|uniref:hypothetical protein n=1 Tax=unclassified Candidatus Pelagibacter TaxID=2647897 RepID=UPI003F824324
MKDYQFSIAIILASLIISIAIILSSKNDQLSNCVDRLLKLEKKKITKRVVQDVTLLCNRRIN